MGRRAFVRSLPPAALAVAGLPALALGGCAGVLYLTPTARGSELAVPEAAVPPGEGAFVRVPGADRPLYLRGDGQGGWVALEARCTHRGCQPEPIGDRLVCPCHGSEFSLDGTVLEGPADRPLRRFEVERDGGELRIRVGQGRES